MDNIIVIILSKFVLLKSLSLELFTPVDGSDFDFAYFWRFHGVSGVAFTFPHSGFF